jgi:hypothetical protein
MIIVMQGKFAHRMLKDQTIESATVVAVEDGQFKVLTDWNERTIESMGLYPAEFDVVRKMLRELNIYVPKETRAIEVKQPPETIAYNPHSPM